MSETPATPEAATPPPSPAASTNPAKASAQGESKSELGAALKEQELSIRSLLEAGVHFGHQPGRWNPLMRSYLFGERNGTHIIDLDQTLPMLRSALDFLRETTAAGGKVLFVGTKRQAAAPIMTEARRSGQYYVNNRWLGGMLTNWKTVKKSIDRYNQYTEILASEDKKAELSKKELSSMTRQVEKYDKSLEGIRSMERIPDAIFVIDVGKEAIAVQEANRLHIPVIGIVDSNCSPRQIDLVVPGNDDAIRAIDLFCTAAANACREGFDQHQADLVKQKRDEPAVAKADSGPKSGRRVVEIKQQPRRGRGQGSAGGGKSYSAGGGKREATRGGAAAPATESVADKPVAASEPTKSADAGADAKASATSKAGAVARTAAKTIAKTIAKARGKSTAEEETPAEDAEGEKKK